MINKKQLFEELYIAHTENDVDKIINNYPNIFKPENWSPLGENENNFGVIENQQSAPIAALIEKITNSIDAVLMKKCLEVGINPKSLQSPQSMEEARTQFFPEHRDWDLASFRNKQAEDIQILADGPRKNTSLIIYDNGEGQHPEHFEDTFLSLLRGNKNEIKFVQGKYNMGGSGALVFCGKKSYQLIASKRFNNKGQFGFTLIRVHPLSKEEENSKKNTWYEYLKIDGKIPSFSINELDLGLFKRKFTTGTVIKLYSYDLPGISDISRDLNQSINEYLFEPVLPVYTIEKKERYPKSSMRRGLYGLKRRLEQEDDDHKYVEDVFSEDFADKLFGKMKVTCYVFKTKIDDRTVKETKETVQREFFKNRMSVLFSLNGQVHGHYTSEFITRSLKMNLLKEHLLIHVDCTEMDYEFRKELFMASRDRLKDGEETRELRRFLAQKLGDKNGRLAEIVKRRKDSISVESEDTKELLKTFAKNITQNEELLKLLDQTLNLDLKSKGKQKNKVHSKKKPKEVVPEPFNPQPFPSSFKRRSQGKTDKDVVSIPIGGEKTILFDTDVENNYFDRVEKSGELKIAILGYKKNETTGGNAPGKVDRVEDVFNARKSSPQDGTIKVHLSPKEELDVGDEIEIKVTLADPDGEFNELFWVKISEPQAPNEPSPRPEKKEDPTLGLPDLTYAYRDERTEKNGELTWEAVAEATGEEMGYDTVMYPMVNGDKLEKVYINMDSNVFLKFKSKHKNPNQEQLDIAQRKYVAAVYSHTLFLYSITKAHKYQLVQENEDGVELDIEVGAYIKDLFSSHYAEFILNFGTDKIMQMLEE